MKIGFPNLKGNIQALLESACYQTLEKIKEVNHDDSLDDQTCFAEIKKVVRLYERVGSNAGGRHDFG